jgi:hypothetical protein
MNVAGVKRIYPDTSYWAAMRCRADDDYTASSLAAGS